MIKIDHVSKSYDGGATKAVRDLSLEIKSGEIFGLLGPNGAGKSTLLNMLAGVLAPSSGTIELDGINVAADPLAAKRNLCYVSDSPDHLLRLKGHEFLRFIADVYEVPCPMPCAARASPSSRASTAWRASWTTRSSPTPTACARR